MSESKLALYTFPDDVPNPVPLSLGRDKRTISHFCMQECVFTLSRWTLTGFLISRYGVESLNGQVRSAIFDAEQ